MNYLIWKNRDSRTINGLIISELPPIIKPQMKVEETEIDGVDGTIIEELGYEAYDKELLIGLKNNANIDEIVNYFNGNGEAIFSNEPDKYYKAKIIDQIDYERLLRFKTATVTFRVQPFKYSATEEPLEYNSGETIIVTNAGYEMAKPIITLKGSGKITFYLNDNSIFDYTFDEDGEVVIDTEKQDAYYGTILKNRNMIGEFPILQAGENKIYIDGSITYMKIEKQSRWL